jgi:hypothetical protein
LRKLVFSGPAFVAAIGHIDPGNCATNIQAGAEYGYMLLWVGIWGQSDVGAHPAHVVETRPGHRPHGRAA